LFLSILVCCSDHIHCCPEGYTCDVQDGKCNKGDVSLPFYVKTKSIDKEVKKNVICPDNISECPSGSTCCQLDGGKWGCCPFQSAACCSDHIHCCPEGF
jgi:hypothetical protein